MARPTKKKPLDQEHPLVEYSAGGVVFKRTPLGLHVAFVNDPYGKWTFAKGHIEAGETVEQAAVRETMEEMGLRSLRVIARLGTIELWFEDRYRDETMGRTVHKYVQYFLMQAAPGAYGRPQKTEKIKAMTWVPLGKVMAKSSYEDAKPILEKALKILNRIEARERGTTRPPATASQPKVPVASSQRNAARPPASRQPNRQPNRQRFGNHK